MTKRNLTIFLFAIALLVPNLAGATMEKDFEAQTTQALINLCTTPPTDPLYQEAINFCHGYLVGAYAYYVASNEGPEGKRLVCFPDPPPTRNEAIAQFIEWAKAHPEYMNEKPVETEFRFLMETWPCKK